MRTKKEDSFFQIRLSTPTTQKIMNYLTLKYLGMNNNPYTNLPVNVKKIVSAQ